MTNKFVFVLLIFSLTFFSCRETAEETFNYSLLDVDTNNVKIFKYDTALAMFPKFSRPLPLTNCDIQLVDSLLLEAVQQFNQTDSKGLYDAFDRRVPIDSFMIDLTKYKRQYFPYKDSNGQRVFGLICFTRTFDKWKEKIYWPRIGGGISTFTLRVNLSDKKADQFSIGGYG